MKPAASGLLVSRRSFLLASPAACLGASKTVPAALFRYRDPSTEFPVLRLTDPSFSSVLPAHYQHSIARRGNFLLLASDLTGRMEAYRLDLKTGVARQVSEEEGLDPRSVTLTPDERAVCCTANNRLLRIDLSSAHAREVYRVPAGYEAWGGFALAEDGLYAALTERRQRAGAAPVQVKVESGSSPSPAARPPNESPAPKASEERNGAWRLRLIRMADGMAATIAESPEELSDPVPRPRRASVLYRRGKSPWLANYDGQQNFALRTAQGEIGPAIWSPDGRTVFYLSYPSDPHRLHNIRELTPDSQEDRPVADTTQFVAFERNADASVFTGASGSKASPHVLLLVRAVKRELTICEHRASDPTMVSPVFSPNSQQVYFVSDRHGKPAIYSVTVEKLVEETGGQ
ncbi:MAG TPA: oligogalacturonate lyase family protein [Bryobacteraceae bacterium]